MFLKRLRLRESIFLSGIPVFGYLIFSHDFDFSGFSSLTLSAIFCALAVFSLGEFFSTNLSLFLLRAGFFAIVSSILVKNIFYIPLLIFLTWLFYYLSRKFLYISDIVLHFFGGILQFLFGVIFFGESIFSPKVILLSFFISLAFTSGYINDLIQDFEEDIIEKQKNIVEILGVKIPFILSLFLFALSYVFLYLAVKEKYVAVGFALFHLISVIIFLSTSNFDFGRFRKVITYYRLSYRILFSVLCFTILILERYI